MFYCNAGEKRQVNSMNRPLSSSVSSDAKKLFEHYVKPHAHAPEWLSVREVFEQTDQYVVTDDLPRDVSAHSTHGVMVEALCNGQIGYAATADISFEGLQKAFERAIHSAQQASTYKLFTILKTDRRALSTKYSTPVQIPFAAMSPAEIIDRLRSTTTHINMSPAFIRRSAIARLVRNDVRLLSSDGLDVTQSFSFISTDVEVTGRSNKDNDIQTRTMAGLRGQSRQGGLEFFDHDAFLKSAMLVAEQTLELLSADDCPNEICDLILMPDQMMLQIHESIGHPLEIDRILGDERNYAGWSFIKPSDFGTLQYGSPLMNVTFDPTPSTEFASYAVDDVGTPAEKKYLIKDGLLVAGLGGVDSQKRSGLPGVANQRASSWNRPPIDRMANINLELGTSTLEQMIASVERGVIMRSNKSWSIDDFRNKFQFGCEYGQLIENGKVTKTLKNPNYRGVTNPFWNSLAMVGDASTFGVYGTPYCGKGEPNQAIRVGHSSPACLFKNIEVFGAR